MAPRLQRHGRHPGSDEEIAHRLGAMARQQKIGARIAGCVGISVDMHPGGGRQLFDQRRRLLQDGLAGVGNLGAAGVEIDGVFVQDRDQIGACEAGLERGQGGLGLFVSAVGAPASAATPLIVRTEP